jgi:2-methylfumaryl-CoA hydratase
MAERSFKYGRLLSDFAVGATYEHPWEVTVDAGMAALFSASFLDAAPVYASAAYARDLGFRDRPIHPLLLLNLGLSFSVHDVSEQAIAHLAYLDVRFPEACFAGDTLHACSTVLGVKPSQSGDRGVVHVRTSLLRDDETVVCRFERRALVRAGRLTQRPDPPYSTREGTPAEVGPAPDVARLPVEMSEFVRVPHRSRGFAGFVEDFAVGDVILHELGRTVSEAEHMQLTFLVRNSHPLHFDELYCKGGASFAGTRVVYGGLVFAWVASLASRDTCGNVLWDMGWDDGAHPSGVVAGDTLYAASKVVAVESHDAGAERVTLRLVGTKNVHPGALLSAGADLFMTEHGKKDGKVPEKVFEITRTVLMRKGPVVNTSAVG